MPHVLGNAGGPPPATRNEILLREAVDRLRAELDAARQAVSRLRDAVEILRHHGSPYRWHAAAWNQGLLIADRAGETYDKAMGGK
jgi:hypothetical protein